MATAYYTPGVYIEEVASGPRPIQGVGTSVTAFIGFSEKAEEVNEDGFTTRSVLGRPKLITNWTQFEKHFGGLTEKVSQGAYMPYAVQGFFNNGGVTAWVISIHAFDSHRSQALIASQKGANDPSLMIHAYEGGPAGDNIKITVKEAKATTSNARSRSATTGPVAQAAATPGAGTAGAAGTDAAAGGGNGGAGTTGGGGAGGGTGGGTPTADNTPQTNGGNADFVLEVERNGAKESFNLKLDDLPLWAERDREDEEIHAPFKKIVKVWRMTRSGKLKDRLPVFGEYQLQDGAPLFDLDLVKQSDQSILGNPNASAEQTEEAFRENAISLFYGSGPKRKGLDGLEAIDDLNLICAPDVAKAHEMGLIDDEGFRGIQSQILTFCQKTDYRFAILDAPHSQPNPENILNWRNNIAGYDSMYGALYYPWIKIMDPVTGRSKFIPPSGHIAGIYARSDSQRGVHKAPANEDIAGVIDVGMGNLPIHVTKGEQALLNPVGINCIRRFPGRGIRIWGARTLSSDPAWRYINVRRLFNYVEESVERSMQWTVFEPNDVYLWAKVRRDVTAFLRTVWLSGALFGVDPNQAFYVKCDEELNPQEIRDQGIMICEIGMAPVKPAEFVVFRFSQYALPAS
ncbi:MAG TPA: phage tail sheath subtilisin-like domain-containing protein [Caldilineaceae bacterium]|nr:phage tail sheath subtilisin-like domain-containing protein [Caldilineaceae bacterium]